MFTTFALIWKEKFVILLSNKFMYIKDGDKVLRYLLALA